MRIELRKRPKNPIIIEGFPGFGLVSTIATEFLVNNLKAEKIGKIIMEEVPPMVAVQKGELVEPLGIFYVKKHNLIILNAVTSVTGHEWNVASLVVQLAKDLKAKEVVCIEGVGSPTATSKAYYLTNDNKSVSRIKKKTKLEKLQEGIIVGVTGALVLHKSVQANCFFVETHSNLPDSRAAAKIIEILDSYLDLKLDPKPLVKQAERFETKLKDLMDKSKAASELKDRKELSYMG